MFRTWSLSNYGMCRLGRWRFSLMSWTSPSYCATRWMAPMPQGEMARVRSAIAYRILEAVILGWCRSTPG
jgi:hypothetical protein